MWVRGDAAAPAPWLDQAVSLEDVGGGAVGWPGMVGFERPQQVHDLLGSEALVGEFRLHDALGDLGRRGVGVLMGSS